MFDMNLSKTDLVGLQVPWLEVPDLQCELQLRVPGQALNTTESKFEWFTSMIQALTCPLPHRAVIWSDATKKSRGSGVGAIIAVADHEPLRLQHRVHSVGSITWSELSAIYLGLLHLKSYLDETRLCETLVELVLCSDSMSALQMISLGFGLQSPLVVDTINLMSGLNIACVHLCYVLDHAGITMQECTDKFAGDSLDHDDVSAVTGFVFSSILTMVTHLHLQRRVVAAMISDSVTSCKLGRLPECLAGLGGWLARWHSFVGNVVQFSVASMTVILHKSPMCIVSVMLKTLWSTC